jgi:serine/threonine protein kinase
VERTTSIAHFNLLERIGAGGLGEVFRARDTKVGRTVALKIVDPHIAGDRPTLERLLADAAAAATLSHPNIATLWDVGEADGRTYLSYEFVAGRRLRDEAAGAPMHPRRALDLAIQVADGVADAHAQGVIHGDLTPDSVMVTAKGNAKILDFGMAAWTKGGATRAAAASNPDALPADAAAVLAYLSPEQAIGSAVDPRTDVFSLGAIVYELVTGRNPFAGTTAAETVMNVIRAQLAPASIVNATAPKDLDAVLARALAPDLAHRQQSAAAFAAELRSVAAVLDVRTGDAVTSSGLLPIDERPDRNAGALLAGILVLTGAAFAAIWWFLSK